MTEQEIIKMILISAGVKADKALKSLSNKEIKAIRNTMTQQWCIDNNVVAESVNFKDLLEKEHNARRYYDI